MPPTESEEAQAAAVAEAWAIALEDPMRARSISEAVLERSTDPHTRACAMRNLGYVALLESDVAAGIRHCDASLPIFVELGDAAGEATVEEILTRLHLGLDAVEVALEHALRTRQLALEVGDPVPIGWALHNLGTVHMKLGDREEALRWYEEAVPHFERGEHPGGVGRTLHFRSKIEVDAGELGAARAHLEEALRIFRAIELPIGVANVHVDLAELDVKEGRSADALDRVAEAEARAPDLPFMRARLALVRAEALAIAADDEESRAEARRAAERAVDHAGGTQHHDLALRALGVLATIERASGDSAAAAAAFEAQVAVAREHARQVEKSRIRNLHVGMEVAAARREAELTDQLLRDVLPASIVRELKLHGRSEPAQVTAATVLFTDLVGFTQIAAKVSPVRLVAALDALFGSFDAVMARFGLEKVKTIGDAYMAVAGAPEPHPAHAVAATLAALHCRQVVTDAAEDEGALGWSIRIGLHSGPLVAGIIGKARLAYDVWGDTVNLASRMESSGEPLRVNVSATTHAKVAPYFETEPRGRVKAKGKGEVEMFFVDRLRPEHAADEAGLVPNDALWAKLRVAEG